MYPVDSKQKEGRVKNYPTPSAILEKNSLFSMGSFVFSDSSKTYILLEKSFPLRRNAALNDLHIANSSEIVQKVYKGFLYVQRTVTLK